MRTVRGFVISRPKKVLNIAKVIEKRLMRKKKVGGKVMRDLKVLKNLRVLKVLMSLKVLKA